MSTNTTMEGKAKTLAALCRRLDAVRGQGYWRSLEELSDTPEFREYLEREFPRYAAEWPSELGRRDFLHLIGASLALGGLSACTKQPKEEIAPYVHQPVEVIPGSSLFFATAMSLGGIGIGLLVESHEGRPTKIEGNPEHPDSLGATDVYNQASILDLYDPDRSQTIVLEGETASWPEFINAAQRILALSRRKRGAGLRLLTETVASPTLVGQIKTLLADLPEARWHQWEPVNRDAALLGARMAWGADVEPIYHIENAACILSIDADFLSCGPGHLRYTREFARRRRPESAQPIRLYAIESTPSNTGMVAEHRLPLRPSEVPALLRALLAALDGHPDPSLPKAHSEWATALLHDLQAHSGTSLVIPGDFQPPIVHALAHAMNQALGNVEKTVSYIDRVTEGPAPQIESLRELAADLSAGRVETLLILDASGGCNPVYSAPTDLRFAECLGRAPIRIHFGPYFDETAAYCKWHLPAAHYLESWSDTRAYDGTASIVQPLIAPLYEGRTSHEVLAAFTDEPFRSAYEIVRAYWRAWHPTPDFEVFWRRALDHGVIPDTARTRRSVSVQKTELLSPVSTRLPDTHGKGSQQAESILEVIFRPDPGVYDGRFANNGWLQELPRPLTRLCWDNVAVISPRMAQRLGLSHREGLHGKEFGSDLVEIEHRGRTIRAPIWIQPGQPDGCVSLTLGYGRNHAGQVGSGLGYNAYELRTSATLWSGSGIFLRKLGKRYVLGSTQLHFTMEGRELVRSAKLDEYKKDPRAALHEKGEVPQARRSLSLYPEYPYPGYAWGMAIDLSACVGCGACVVACQAENNIPVVGKQQVVRGREMHWLRVDLYHRGSIDNPEGYFEPVPCMHCENAPCELVCPVAATVHSAEGLNDMVYNRCIGTRYCSNNCPYKVRRFNFLLYWNDSEPNLIQKNPNVTVRSRGVMEKCTYCVQRITAGRIRAEEAGRRIVDGEVQTACQAACPAEAIIFGDINDPESRVKKLKDLQRNYELLSELNTRPRTTYLAAVRNPNPDVKGG